MPGVGDVVELNQPGTYNVTADGQINVAQVRVGGCNTATSHRIVLKVGSGTRLKIDGGELISVSYFRVAATQPVEAQTRKHVPLIPIGSDCIS